MNHWFDRLCVRLSGPAERGALPRREFVQGAVSTVTLGLLGGSHSLLGAMTRAPQNSPLNSPLRQKTAVNTVPFQMTNKCQRQHSANTLSQGVVVSQSGVDFQQQLTYDAAAKTLTTTVVAHKAGQLIINATVTTASDKTGTATVNYGPALHGISQANLRLTAQQTSGTIDGRAVTAPRGATNNASSITFADRRPAAVLTPTDQSLATILPALVKQANGQFTSCKTTPSSASHSVTAAATRPATVAKQAATGGKPVLLSTRDYKPGQGGANDPGDGWYEPGGTYNAPNCDQCWDNCGDLAKDKSGIDDWKVWVCGPVCWAEALTAYNVIWLACWGTCQLPGGGCCPVPCGGVFTCCGRNDNCFRGDLCCPASMKVCNNVCCGPNISSCSPDGSCGCPTGQINCGKSCCTAGQVCCGGVCAAPADCKNGVYCPTPSHICNGACCPPFNPCCNNQCCAGTCVNNVCCPDPKRVCGNTCCAAGQVCSNGACLGCPTGIGVIKTFPCQSVGANGQMIGTCCPITSPNCCGGVCCGIGQNFCNKVNGKYVCTNVNPSPIH